MLIAMAIPVSATLSMQPINTCSGQGELYLYSGDQFQEPDTSLFTVRDQILIFTKTYNIKSVLIDGETPNIVFDETNPFGVRVYSKSTIPGQTMFIDIDSKKGAKGIQAYLTQDSGNPVFDISSMQIVIDDAKSNTVYLAQGTYNFVFFDKYTLENDGTDDSRQLTVSIFGPNGFFQSETYTKPSPVGTQGVVIEELTVTQAGLYTISVNTKDSIYWAMFDCNGENLPPTAQFEYSPSNPFVNQDVTFTSTSYDLDGTITKYEWKVEGVVVSTQESFIRQFPVVGSPAVTLTVWDNNGASNSITGNVPVQEREDTGDNPIAIIIAPDEIISKEKFVLDGSESYDPNGDDIVQYEWIVTFYGEEKFRISSTYPTTEISLDKIGRYLITLIVTDETGKTGIASQQIKVTRFTENEKDAKTKSDLIINYHDIYGSEYGVIHPNDFYMIYTTVTNGLGKTLREAFVTFSIPELGYQHRGDRFRLSAGESSTIFFGGELPFTEDEIVPGEYIALISVKGDGYLRSKYFPLIIE